MTNHGTKIRLALLSTVALAFCLLLVYVFINIRAENRETAQLSSLTAQSEQEEAATSAIRELRSSAGAEIEAFEQLTLSNERLVPLIESIENMGRALKLSLKIASVEKQDGGEGAPQIIRMVVEAEGGWSGTFSLLRGIEALPYRVMIDSVSLSKEDGGWKETVTLSLHSFN